MIGTIALWVVYVFSALAVFWLLLLTVAVIGKWPFSVEARGFSRG